MAGDTVITIIGNLTADPELRFTPNGAAVANLTIASTPRQFDRQANEWKDGETLFMRCSIWREAAENVAESLKKGTRVIAQGRLKQRSFEQDGQRRTVVEMEIDEIGPSLRYATASTTKTQRSGGGGFGGNSGGNAGGQGGGWNSVPQGGAPQQNQQQNDPWASGGNTGGGQPQGSWDAAPNYDEPPF
ncbi:MULTISPECIES: single-stranded DNA-binding protein [Kytococcus]|uniref:Single-stranded DNA-binding protein n=1 Tax=Kytococcus schroeteri TaxID=138300 RepID=A0A2I1PD15_9MICO|nr:MULTISPECIES: single-stranded DNA-binding protein [Kytococcus]OFS15902.1 single-stranded DNA-binding protein [Kytococcus sp. HMSC28H12]PKZ42471.1 single-stranded DNA-binding protein [Kytococcus schroeteri]